MRYWTFSILLTFSYYWEILYEPHCQQCWVKFTHAGHVILQLILEKLWSKTLLRAFEPYKLPFLTSQLHLAWRAPQNVVSQPYLIFPHKPDIEHFLFLLTFREREREREREVAQYVIILPYVNLPDVDLPLDLPIWALTVELWNHHSCPLDASTRG